MIATLVISLITFVLIILSIFIFPHIKIGKITIDTYWIVSFIGAIILIIFNFVLLKEVGKELISGDSINPLTILVLFFSMTFLSIYLDEAGLFKFLALHATKKVKTSQISLFLIIYSLTAVLTIFTSNDIVILTMTPFICLFSKHAKVNPLPYLIGEFAAANTYSMMLIIGNPTNIYLATSAQINFLDYLKVMFFPTILAGAVEIILILLIFRKMLHQPLSVSDEEEYHIENKLDLIIGIIHLASCLILLTISSYLNLKMWIISLCFALSLLLYSLVRKIFTKRKLTYAVNSIKRLPYQLFPFVMSMFIIVSALNAQGISSKIAEFLGNNNTTWTYGFSSYLFANVINNIPMSILYSNLVETLVGEAYTHAVYATIIGSNIGAFLTPIGALAGIMFVSLVNKYDVKFKFMNFIEYGFLISLPTLATALLVSYFVI